MTHTADNGSYLKGTLTVHYTTSTPGTPCSKVRTICGQSHKRSYFMVHTATHEVNCIKCLTTTTKG